MRLRLRLALTVVAAAIPLATGTVWVRRDVERRQVEQVLREFALTRMEAGGRQRCEADPERFPPPARPLRPPPPPEGLRREGLPGAPPGPPRGRSPGPGGRHSGDEIRTVFWAYADDLVSRNPRAPAIPSELADALRAGADVVSVPFVDGDGAGDGDGDGDGDGADTRYGHQAAVRMPWTDSPCAFVLVRRTGRQPPGGPQDLWWAAAILAGGVLLAVSLAVGPVVRRIRSLEAGVRRSARERYATPVEVGGNDEVADLARAFNEAGGEVRAHLAAVEEREATLRRFVANTTHDVMTPLTVLQGHLDALRTAVDTDDLEAREALVGGLREVDYTTALVANLSTAARLEGAGQEVARHRIDLSELVERVTARHRPLASALGVELNAAVPERPLFTRGDVTLLEQAVGNVVGNAIRYNDVGGHVAVLLRAPATGTFEIEVVDDGPGLGEADIAKLTKRGWRGGEARTRRPGGHGIGLDIAKSVCGHHGMELRFARSEHGGLAVTFRGETAE